MAKVTGVGGVFFKSTGDRAALGPGRQQDRALGAESVGGQEQGCVTATPNDREAIMRMLRLVATGTAALLAVGCGHDTGFTDPSARALSGSGPSLSARRVETSGSFDAIVDFSTLELTPTGRNCRLDVDGRLVFHGSIEGVGVGHTTALVFASCTDVIAAPGTDPDVFHSDIEFTGTVGGEAVRAHVLYQGRSQPGGHIDGRLVFSNGAAGELSVSAQIAVGGVYDGSLVVP